MTRLYGLTGAAGSGKDAACGQFSKYLVVGKGKGYNQFSAKLATNAPSLKSNEIAIKLYLNIPDELFMKPQLEANITVPQSSVITAPIEAEVLSNISEIVSKELGVDLTIEVMVSD